MQSSVVHIGRCFTLYCHYTKQWPQSPSTTTQAYLLLVRCSPRRRRLSVSSFIPSLSLQEEKQLGGSSVCRRLWVHWYISLTMICSGSARIQRGTRNCSTQCFIKVSVARHCLLRCSSSSSLPWKPKTKIFDLDELLKLVYCWCLLYL
jgi:hypothetical protein